MEAAILGLIRYLIGSIRMVERASICSEMRWMPISVVMDDPADWTKRVGTSLRDYLGLDDAVIEVDLTPDRGDCLSLAGIAREVGVINRAPLTVPEFPDVAAGIEDAFTAEVKDAWVVTYTTVADVMKAAAAELAQPAPAKQSWWRSLFGLKQAS